MSKFYCPSLGRDVTVCMYEALGNRALCIGCSLYVSNKEILSPIEVAQ